MIKPLLMKLVGMTTHKLLKKQFDQIALYKPVEVKVDGLIFPVKLIDTCHYIHKSMIAILERGDKDLTGYEKTEAENSHDYVAAILLQNYFTVWCNDVKDMHKLTDGGE